MTLILILVVIFNMTVNQVLIKLKSYFPNYKIYISLRWLVVKTEFLKN